MRQVVVEERDRTKERLGYSLGETGKDFFQSSQEILS
jgi:hypothetical protein